MELKVRNERLQELRRVVAAVPDELLYMFEVRMELDCGTAYCAAGWAGQDPYFVERGFKLGHSNVRYTSLESSIDVFGFDALKEFFGLSDKNTEKLFGTGMKAYRRGAKKEHVLANIDRLLTGKAALCYERSLTRLEAPST